MDPVIKRLRRLRGVIKNEEGGTLAEMALTVPLLIVLLAAVAEIGRYFQSYTTLTKSTRAAARYLSNHQYNPIEIERAKNLVICGRLTTCTEAERLVKDAELENVCIQTTKVTGSEQIEFVTVSIPKDDTKTCDNNEVAVKLPYQPVFNLGALLHNDAFTLTYPLAPSTTMRYIP